MRLVSIELKNIGLYANQSILFPCEGKEALLFWGNNGAGKTTLLSSIKIGLLGQKAFSSFDDYCSFVAQNLVSSRLDRAKDNASVRVSFEVVEDNERRIYSILRRWSFENEVLSEDASVFCKGTQLDFVQSERIQNKVQSILPPSLMDVLIFDGENAINLLQKDQMPVLVKNIIFSIFGMDIYAQTVRDLSACLKNVSLDSAGQSDEVRAIEISSRYKQALANERGYRKLFEETQAKKKTKLATLTSTIKKLSQRIGVSFDDLETIKEDLAGMQDNRKKLQGEIKYACEEILPLKILMPRLLQLKDESDREQPFHVLQTLHALKYYFRDDAESAAALSELEKKIVLPGDQEDLIGMSDRDILLLERTLEVLESYPKTRLQSYITQKNTVFGLIQEKLLTLDKLADPEAGKLLSIIEEVSLDVEALSVQLESLEAELSAAEQELASAKKEYDELKKTLSTAKKSSNAYIEITRYRDSLEEFIEKKTSTICEKLNRGIQSELAGIGYRNGSIKRVEINPKDFSISLFEFGGKLIPFSVFSAGEKQILLGLIIKESLKLSGIDGFFLFDTPVGRLDMSNRAIFTNEVIFKVANQVMVFATDSDYSRTDYFGIKGYLTSERILTRNEHDQIVVKDGSIYSGVEGK